MSGTNVNISTSKFSLCDKYGEMGFTQLRFLPQQQHVILLWARNRQNLTMILYFSEILLLKTKAANFELSFFFSRRVSPKVCILAIVLMVVHKKCHQLS